MKPTRREPGFVDEAVPPSSRRTTVERQGPTPFDVPRSIEQVRTGSAEAIGPLLEHCRRYLLGIANRELHSGLRPKAGASDLVQESLLRAQQGFGGFRGRNEDELLAWLRRILLNQLANLRREFQATEKRRLSREQPLGGDSRAESMQPTLAGKAPSPSSVCARKEQGDSLNETLAGLPPAYQRVLRLRYWERQSYTEIGEHLGCSTEAARKLWARALERLERELDHRSHERSSEPAGKPR